MYIDNPQEYRQSIQTMWFGRKYQVDASKHFKYASDAKELDTYSIHTMTDFSAYADVRRASRAELS